MIKVTWMCGKEGDQYKCGVDVIMNDLDRLRQQWETKCDEECWLNDNVNMRTFILLIL